MVKHQLRKYSRYVALHRLFLLLVVYTFAPLVSLGQSDTLSVRSKLLTSAIGDSILQQKVDLSAGSVPFADLIRGIAKANHLNILISNELNFNVTSNFKQVPVVDILSFLCNEYNLSLDVIGAIIKINPVKPKPIFNDPNVFWDSGGRRLKLDLKGDSLYNVIKKISTLSGVNLLLPHELNGKKVWGYVDNLPIENALSGFASVNKLEVKRINDNTYSIQEIPQPADAQYQGGKPSVPYQSRSVNIESANAETKRITAQASGASLDEIITQIVTRLNIGYVFSSKLEGNATFTFTNIKLDELLNALFVGTNYAYKKENNVYVFGLRTNLEIYEVRTIKMRYRTIDNVEPIIPASLKTGIQISLFKELNSIVISGNPTHLDKLEQFLRQIDQVIPLIYIEVLIVDIKKTVGLSAGLEAGLGETPAKTKGKVLSGVDLTLGSGSINNLIDGFNGFGWVNLGKVTPQFYMSIKALEQNGDIKIRSTPKLSTLNGHEAVITSGETKYYKEELSNWFGSQNPQLSNTFVWKSVNADLKVVITPVVSDDEQITMTIEVTQSEFTPREPADAPPGSINRSFKSLIRVKNEEMVLLGGLEKNTSSVTSSGIPFLARVPVIKWFFSSTDKSEEETKLTIFVKPIVIN